MSAAAGIDTETAPERIRDGASAWAEALGVAAVAVAWRPSIAAAVVATGVVAARVAQVRRGVPSRLPVVGGVVVIVVLVVTLALDPFAGFAAPLLVLVSWRSLVTGRFPARPYLVREAWLRGAAWFAAGVATAHVATGHTASPHLTVAAAGALVLALPVLLAAASSSDPIRRTAVGVGALALAAAAVGAAAVVAVAGLRLFARGPGIDLLLRPVAVVVEFVGSGLYRVIEGVFHAFGGHHVAHVPPPRGPGHAAPAHHGGGLISVIPVVPTAIVFGIAALLIAFVLLRRLRQPRPMPQFVDEPTYRERRVRIVRERAGLRQLLMPRRRPATRRGPNAERVRVAFRRVVDAVVEGAPPAALTATEVAVRVADAAPGAGEAAARLAIAYRAARYGRGDVEAAVADRATADAASVCAALGEG